MFTSSELRLRLGPRRCDAAIWHGRFRPRATGHVSAAGSKGDAIDTALAELLAQGHELPPRAALSVEDEYLYTLLLPADRARRDAEADAAAQFTQWLGHDALRVQACLAPCGGQWIVVALEAELLDQWREALGARGVELRQVRPAWLEDLNALREPLRDHTGLVVLVRAEGASVIGVDAQTITRLEWERFDVNDAQQFGARIDAHCLQHAGALEALPAVCVVPLDPAQHARLETLCAERGWALGRALTRGSA